MRITSLLFVLFLVSAHASAQPDPVVGNWRGSLKTAAGSESPVVITIGKSQDRYVGSTNGLADGADVSLRRITVNGGTVAIEASAESRLGEVVLAATLTAQDRSLSGEGTIAVGPHRFPVTLTLQRRQRADVAQHQVEQTADYFVGRWAFEYVGGQFPPLSSGNRQGTVTFARVGDSAFVTGTLSGTSFGSAFEERITLGVDADQDMVVWSERRADGSELLSLGNWRSPLAVVFTTEPIERSGRRYQLRRVFRVLSESAFDVSEEFAIAGGPFRRLGSGHYTKQ